MNSKTASTVSNIIFSTLRSQHQFMPQNAVLTDHVVDNITLNLSKMVSIL